MQDFYNHKSYSFPNKNSLNKTLKKFYKTQNIKYYKTKHLLQYKHYFINFNFLIFEIIKTIETIKTIKTIIQIYIFNLNYNHQNYY